MWSKVWRQSGWGRRKSGGGIRNAKDVKKRKVSVMGKGSQIHVSRPHRYLEPHPHGEAKKSMAM